MCSTSHFPVPAYADSFYALQKPLKHVANGMLRSWSILSLFPISLQVAVFLQLGQDLLALALEGSPHGFYII